MNELDIPGRTAADALLVWPVLTAPERLEAFLMLSPDEREELFLSVSSRAQAGLVTELPAPEGRRWLRMLAPDDAADLLQEVSPEERSGLLELIDAPTRSEITALLAYAEDQAGGLMNPRFARLRPAMTIDEAITYLRRQGPQVETIHYAYVLGPAQELLGALSVRDLFAAPAGKHVQDVMRTELVTVPETMDQESVALLIAQEDLTALPVVDDKGRMRGIVTVDDLVDVVQEEASEDIQKMGGMTAFDRPYLQTPFGTLLKKRAGWLTVLFLGEMLTASAMGFFEGEIARAVVLALFVPLIISSGGNSGSQAATLVIRAMALREVGLRDWWRIVRREFAAGLALGAILASVGFLRIVLWQSVFHTYGQHYVLVALTVAVSLLGVVTWGTLAGSMLPFVIRRAGFDPASASAPFVATLVDVSGLVIYFSAAQLFLRGTLL